MPFKSKAQQRWMFAAAKRGEVPKSMPKEFAAKTDFKSLPGRLRSKFKKRHGGKACPK